MRRAVHDSSKLGAMTSFDLSEGSTTAATRCEPVSTYVLQAGSKNADKAFAMVTTILIRLDSTIHMHFLTTSRGRRKLPVRICRANRAEAVPL